MNDLEKFVQALELSLLQRWQQCDATATPDTILLDVLNAVVDARVAIGIKDVEAK